MSLLACRRVAFGTSTGHFWHVDGPLLFYYFYYLRFSSLQAVQYYFEWNFANFSLFPSTSQRNLKLSLSLSFNTNLKRNLVLASPRSLLARRRVTFGTSTGHFWHVSGPLLFYYFYYLRFSSPQAVQYYFEKDFANLSLFPSTSQRNLKLSLSLSLFQY